MTTLRPGRRRRAPEEADRKRIPRLACAAAGLLLGGCIATVDESKVAVEVSPAAASLAIGASWTFACTVTGAADTACTWSVREGASGGTVTPAGLYTAPSSAGTYHVVAASRAAPAKQASAVVAVSTRPPPPPAAVTVTVAPSSASVETGGTADFSAVVSGAAAGQPTSVTWTARDPGGASVPSALARTATGVRFTAPQATGTYAVVATSDADPAGFDAATVAVRSSGGCSDACPAPVAGVTWQCEKRFLYGTNWAWKSFAGDFGGGWGPGVSSDPAAFSSLMADMKAAGVSVIRWWMFPRLVSPSILWGPDGAPSGIGGTLAADVQKALELADQHDLYLVLTPFSFDNFRPTTAEQGRSIRPMVVDPALRRKLLDNLVKPVAQAVETSPHKKRMLAWDMINEPEWAMTGPNMYGGQDFPADSKNELVTHAEMEAFLSGMAATLRASSTALLSIGGAAIKWGTAWKHVDQDFYMLHYYDWVYEWFPYQTVTLASVGLTDKPVVMGEFPLAGLSAVGGHPARTPTQFAEDLWGAGYAGMLSWAYNDTAYPWSASAVSAFAGQHPCETRY